MTYKTNKLKGYSSCGLYYNCIVYSVVATQSFGAYTMILKYLYEDELTN